MRLSNYIFCGLVFFTLQSCGFGTIWGDFYLKNDMFSSYKLSLNKDMTFSFSWREGLMVGASNGVWERRKNIIRLNTIPKNNSFVDEYDLKKNKISIYVFNSDKELIENAKCSCIIQKDTIVGFSDVQGFCYFPFFQKIDEIIVESMGQIINYKVQKGGHNFSVLIDTDTPIIPSVFIFSNYEFIVKNKRKLLDKKLNFVFVKS